jgi:hypothetical protein
VSPRRSISPTNCTLLPVASSTPRHWPLGRPTLPEHARLHQRTVATRGAYDVAPMFLLTAPTAGTGKSHLVDLISRIARGRVCPVITAGNTEEEAEKRLGHPAARGTPIVSLDNYSPIDDADRCQLQQQSSPT